MNLKKLTSAFLALAMTLTALPSVTAEEYITVSDVTKTEGGVSAVNARETAPEEDFRYEVNEDWDSVTIIGYGGEGGYIVMPHTIDGKSVTSIGYGAFAGCTSLTTVEIPDSVTSIGDCAFSGCTSLTSVEIPDSVASIKDYAFAGCTSLTSIEIPDSVTSMGDHIFFGCTSLTTVEIPDSVTSIGDYAFSYCTSMTIFEIPDSVTSIGDYAFSYCTSMTFVEIPDSVTTIGNYAFYECISLTSVEIPNSVTSIGYDDGAFKECTSLTEINVGNDNKYYSSLNGVLFNKNKTNLIQYPAGKQNESYDIPNSVTSIGNSAFFNCTSLTSVEIPDSVTSIGNGVFVNCTSLISVEISDSVTSIGNSAFYNCTSLTCVEIPDSVTSIGAWAFYDCTLLTSIEIPDSVTSIGYHVFSNCTNYLTIYGYKNSTAETYANFYRINFISIDDSTKIQIDGKTGIVVTDTDLTNKTLTVEKGESANTAISFNITLTDENGNEVQPEGNVTVKIPVPAGRDGNGCIVYRIEEDKKYTDMKAEYKDGCLIFVTDHFSEYIITQKPGVQEDEGKPTEEITECDHDWGEWEVVIEPTTEKEGIEKRVCKICGKEETKAIEKLSPSADNDDTSSSDNDNGDNNAHTGAALAIVPVLAAGAAVIVFRKKRK